MWGVAPDGTAPPVRLANGDRQGKVSFLKGFDTLPLGVGVLMALDAAGLKALKEHGAEIYSCEQQKQQALFVPPGFIVAEAVTSGVLVYGVRLSLLIKSEKAAGNYDELIGLATNSGQGVQRMEQIAEFMRPSEG